MPGVGDRGSIAVGVGGYAGMTMADFGVYERNPACADAAWFVAGCPFNAFGAGVPVPVPGALGTFSGDPSPASPDIEFALVGFSTLSGGVSTSAENILVGLSLFQGSLDDGGIGEEFMDDLIFLAATTTTTTTTTIPILNDPSLVRHFDDPKKMDFWKMHARIVPEKQIDFSQEPVTYRLGNENGVLFEGSLVSGDLKTRSGKRYKFKDNKARRVDRAPERDGIGKAEFKVRRGRGDVTFRLQVFSDMSQALLPEMYAQIDVAGNTYGLTDVYRGGRARRGGLKWKLSDRDMIRMQQENE